MRKILINDNEMLSIAKVHQIFLFIFFCFILSKYFHIFTEIKFQVEGAQGTYEERAKTG